MEHFNRFRNFNRIGKNFDTCHHVVHSSLENIFINLICNCTKKAYIKYRPFSRLKFASHSILVKLDVSSPSFLDTASTWPNMAIRSTPVITLSKKERGEKYDPTDRLLRFFHYPNKYEEEYKPRFESRCLKFDSETEEFIVRIEFGHTGSL